jgi:hypothetical protein
MIVPVIESAPVPPIPALGSGSFASPICGGPPRQAAGALLRALEARVRGIDESFASDVQSHCDALAEQSDDGTVSVRLLRRVPEDPDAGYAPTAERFHIDFDPDDPIREGLRLVRVYRGEGTWWIPSDSEPEVIRELRAEPTVGRYQAAMAELEQRPPAWRVVPAAHTFRYLGGLRRGLLHRAPPCTSERLLLVVTARKLRNP